MPLRVRVTLEMVHFDERAVGGAPESYAHYLRCRYEQVLNENSFRDAFVAQKREGHLCGVCMGAGRDTQGSCIARDGAF